MKMNFLTTTLFVVTMVYTEGSSRFRGAILNTIYHAKGFYRFPSTSFEHCYRLCIYAKICESSNWISGTGECQLNIRDDDSTGSTYFSAGSVHVADFSDSLQWNPCSARPCSPHHICVPVTKATHYRCLRISNPVEQHQETTHGSTTTGSDAQTSATNPDESTSPISNTETSTTNPGESTSPNSNTETSTTDPGESTSPNFNSQSSATSPGESTSPSSDAQTSATNPGESTSPNSNTETSTTNPGESTSQNSITQTSATNPSESSSTSSDAETPTTNPGESTSPSSNAQTSATDPGESSSTSSDAETPTTNPGESTSTSANTQTPTTNPGESTSATSDPQTPTTNPSESTSTSANTQKSATDAGESTSATSDPQTPLTNPGFPSESTTVSTEEVTAQSTSTAASTPTTTTNLQCSSDTDCPAGTTCVDNKCTCAIGFQYDHGSGSCRSLSECTTYGSTFTFYADEYIKEYNEGIHYGKTTEECAAICTNGDINCKSFELFKGQFKNRCFIQIVNWADISSEYQGGVDSYDIDHYQRDCVWN